MGYELIDSLEKAYMDIALKRLLPIPNICVLGNTRARRHPILSFLVFTSFSMDPKTENRDTGVYMWGEGEKKKNKPLHGRFVAKLLNDLFGIQARGGCACAGPYGHYLLGVNEPLSLALRSAVQKDYEGLKPGWTRVSFSYCMSKEEFEFILASIKFVAEYGERFLPLYHFNWRSGSWTFRKRSNKGNVATNEIGLDLINLSIKFGSANENTEENEGNVSDNDERVRNMINKYTSYLERAKCIAYSLPKIPPQRKVSEDIDPSLILFRI